MTENTEIVPVTATSLQLGAVPMATHKEVVQHATEVAKNLAQIIEDCRLFVNIQGKKFVRVEGWETLGAMLGIIPREEAVVEKDDGEIEAAVELILVSTGQRVGRGSAIVGADEKSWQSRPKYARRSMAITRATGKAFRLSLSWIMSMAGYEPTPAEEMDNVIEGQYTERVEPKPQPAQDKKPAPAPSPARPYPPEALRDIIQSAVEQKVKDGITSRDKAEKDPEMLRSIVVANLENLFAGDKASTDKRHTLTAFLTGKNSTKELTTEELVTLKRWVNAKPDSGGEWHPDPLAVKEAEAAVRAAMVGKGQTELEI